MATVTRTSLQTMLENEDRAYVGRVIGRALIVLFKNQTADEQRANTTNKDNGIGFTGADAKSGSITAKTFMKYGKLEDWQIDRWLKRGANGYSRLTKYHKQLNEAAKQKA